MHANEKKYLCGPLHERRKRDYLAGRYAAKLTVARFLNESDLCSIEIRQGVFHQPIVRHASCETPEVTISHCKDLAVAISYPAGHYMGVDVECVDVTKKDLYISQMTKKEMAMDSCLAVPIDLVPNIIWTIKEAISKTIKVGFTTSSSMLEISTLKRLPDGSFVALFKNLAQYKCHAWVIRKWILSIALPKNSELRFCPSLVDPIFSMI